MTATIPTIMQVHPVENELLVHTSLRKDLAEYLQALDKFVRRRARTINPHGTDFSLRSREETRSPAESDIFQ